MYGILTGAGESLDGGDTERYRDDFRKASETTIPQPGVCGFDSDENG
jgi:hypothetical protein